MASDDAKVREAAERACDDYSNNDWARKDFYNGYLRGHADASASPDDLRVVCRGCMRDTARAKWARCYNCRQQEAGYSASLRELQAAAVEYRAASEGYYEAVAEEAECTGKWLTAAEQQSKAAERRLEAADARLAALLTVPAEGAKVTP